MFCFVILSDAKKRVRRPKGLKAISQMSLVPARDPSDTTFCQDDKTLVLFLKLWTSSPLVVYFATFRKQLLHFRAVCTNFALVTRATIP